MSHKISRRSLLKKLVIVSGSAGLGIIGMDDKDSALASPMAQSGQNQVYFPVVMKQPAQLPLNPSPPAQTQRLVFIHQSTGRSWLADEHGRLGLALQQNNYFVSDTFYGWGPGYPGGGQIGDHTDIGNWFDWFQGTSSSLYLNALYQELGQQHAYSRLASNPGGENSIILFKSCFPNSAVKVGNLEPPTNGINPLRSQSAGLDVMTVGNIKGIYTDLLSYFATRLDKLFVLITAPPLREAETNPTEAANARAVNNWLVTQWLAGYPHKNVAVFDFYNVLTSNGGGPDINDAGALTGNHHRYRNNVIEHISNQGSNFSMYPAFDSHPTAVGDLKATLEFLPVLNIAYNRWKA